MDNWIPQSENLEVEPEILEESALAGAQATIQIAMERAKLKPSELAESMGRPRSFISKMLSGSHNLTVKTFARALAACGFEPRFGLTPINWGWSVPIPEPVIDTVPAPAGILMLTLAP